MLYSHKTCYKHYFYYVQYVKDIGMGDSQTSFGRFSAFSFFQNLIKPHFEIAKKEKKSPAEGFARFDPKNPG